MNKVEESFDKAMEEFVTQRINWHGGNETEAVSGAFIAFRSCVEHLRETLSEEQLLLLRDCENAYSLSTGESERFYYKAGVGDAVRFLRQFGEEQ